VRKEISRRPQAAGKLLFEEMPDYRFSLYVTNLDLPLDQIWNIYNTRADCESSAARQTVQRTAQRARRSRSQNRIRELKQDFGLDAFCLQDFWATEASFRFIMVAYNLMSLFRHFALNSRNTATLSTLRSYCFAIGGWVSQHSRKKVLKLSLPRSKRPWMDSIFQKIDSSPPPLLYPIA
jgi:hypothetical protein